MEAVIGTDSVYRLMSTDVSAKCDVWHGLLCIFSGRIVAALPIYTIT